MLRARTRKRELKKSVFLQSIKKKKTMKKKIKTKEEARAFFQKIIDDKNAMIDCIENGGDMKALIKNRGIEIVKPLSVQKALMENIVS